MPVLAELRSLTAPQRHAVAASYLGWMLDAFDFFTLVFVLKAIAAEFATDVTSVALAITLTLAMRPLGALLFGRLADRWGRRPTLMLDVLLYSGLAFLSAFAPSLTALIALRALYGIAMGGEWGVGAALAMESIPPRSRGAVSGLLQVGYPSGYLLAALAYFALFPVIGWRGLFAIGILPALLVLYIRRRVEESPDFLARRRGPAGPGLLALAKRHAGLAAYVVLLMTALNFFSHGTQDLYPTFLQAERGLAPGSVGLIAIVYNVGAILGGLCCGALSERLGRRRTIALAALLSLPVLPLWAFAGSPLLLAAGAFVMQFLVQGAWGVVPAHLNELSPAALRGTFPGFSYQLGNLLASVNATLQAGIAERHGGDYALALALVAGSAAVILAVLAVLGPEARGAAFAPAEGKDKGAN